MALPYFPQRGEILICDFDSGFRAPEMVKLRPVVVVSPKSTHSRRLCTVVPLSTTAPTPVKPWHHPLPRVEVPGWTAGAPMWAKCDMLVTVSFDRLNKPYLKTRAQGRRYIEAVLSAADIDAVAACIRAYLDL